VVTTQSVTLELPDLSELIHVLGEVGPKSTLTTEVLELIGLSGQEEQAATSTASSRWQAAIKVALESEGPYLRKLLDCTCDKLPPASKRMLNEARVDAATAFVNRVLHTNHPELGDQVGQLASARDYGGMKLAAENLRSIALDARRMLMDSQLGNELALQLGTIDPEQRRFELADLAINVVTVTNYLLYLIEGRPSDTPENFSAEQSLGNPSVRSPIPPSQKEDADLRYRKVLDAHATAIRFGGRLLLALRSETVTPL
jgi:hypothetical protein